MQKNTDKVHKKKTISKNTAQPLNLSEESNSKSAEKYRNFLKNINDGCFELDLAGKFIFLNDSVCRITGYSSDELMGMSYRQYTDEETAKRVHEEYHKVYMTGKPSEGFGWQITRKDGATRYVETSVSLQKDSSGKPTGFIGIVNDITDRKRAETLLRQSEEKYRLLADHTKDLVWLMDLDLKWTYISPSAEKLWGYALEEIIALPLDKFLTAASFKTVMKFYAIEMSKALAVPSDYSLMQLQQIECRCKNGRTLWVECFFSFIRDGNGKPLSLLGEGRDITERKQIENELRASESNFRHSLDESPLGIRISTVEGETIYANKAILDIYEYDSIEKLKKTSIKERYTPQSYAEFLERKKKRLKGEFGPAEYEISIVRKNGEVRHLHVFRKEIFWDGKKQSQVIYNDITLRRQAEENIRQSEEKYRTILENMQEGYFEVDLAGKFTFCNDSLCRIHQRSKDEMTGMNNRQYMDKENVKKVFEAFNRVYKTGDSLPEINWQIIRKDGITRYIEASVSLMKDSSDKPIGFRGVTRDITERKKAEEEILKLASIVRSSSELVSLCTLDEKMIFLNEAGSKMLGIDPDKVGDYSIKDVIPEPYVSTVRQQIIPALLSGKNWEGDLLYRNIRTGVLTDVHATTFIIKYAGVGAPIFLANVSLDITERKLAEQKLQQTLNSLKKAVGTTIQVLVSALEARDPYTAGHQSRTANLACAIATEMGVDNHIIEGIHMAGIIHDIGKLSIPTEILAKPTKLTNLELSLIKTHSQSGYEMLKDVESPWPLAPIVHQHHERIDGSGYPSNLKGDEIILEARILAVADVVEAMASHRPYRASLGIEAALEEIEKNKGLLYDAAVADTCLGLFREKGYQLT
jgi:PAS domain S-box-containing protein